MEDLLTSFGALACIVPLVGLVILVLFVIAYINTYYHIKNISVQASSILSEISKQRSPSDQNDRWYLDHCFMSNLGPHEWFANGKQDEHTFQFQCRKCGYIVNVPKVLSVRDGVSRSLSSADNK